MQTVRAVVTAVDGKVAEVEVESAGCGRCREPGGCGGQNLSRAFCGTRRFRTENTLELTVGDRLRLGIDDVHVRSAANRAYLLPLGLMATGAFLGTGLSSMASAVGAFVGLGVGWALLVRNRHGELPPPQMLARVVDE